jgi:hypothetical protein
MNKIMYRFGKLLPNDISSYSWTIVLISVNFCEI